MSKNKIKSMIFHECFSSENLKEAFYFVKKNVETDNLNTLPIGAGTIAIIEQYHDDFFRALSEEIISKGIYTPDKCKLLFSRKDASFGIRPIAILSIIDRIVYQAILNRNIIGDLIEDTLIHSCYANRIDRGGGEYSEKGSFLKHYKKCWGPFCHEIKQSHIDGYIHFARMDIHSFYENIQLDTLAQIMRDEFYVSEEILISLYELLENWTEFSGSKTGIPQGPDPSAILANIYLHSLDTAIESIFPSKIRYFRYNDDIVFLSKEESDLYTCIDFIIEHLRNKSLKANAKGGIYLFATLETIEREIVQISGNNESPDMKIEKCQSEMSEIFQKIKTNIIPDTREKRAFNYYLKRGYSSRSEFDVNHLTDFISLFSKFPLVIESLFYFFLRIEISGFTVRLPINNDEIYKQIFIEYKNGYGNSWQKFNILKLLTISKISRGTTESAIDFIKYITDEFKNKNDVFLQILYIRFFYEEKSKDIEHIESGYKDRLFKSYIQSLKKSHHTPAILSTILWLFRHDTEMIASIIQHYAKNESYELQIISFYYLKELGNKLQNNNQCGSFIKKLLHIPNETEGVNTNENKNSTTNIFSINVTNIQQVVNVKFEEKIKKGKEKINQNLVVITPYIHYNKEEQLFCNPNNGKKDKLKDSYARLLIDLLIGKNEQSTEKLVKDNKIIKDEYDKKKTGGKTWGGYQLFLQSKTKNIREEIERKLDITKDKSTKIFSCGKEFTSIEILS